MHSWERSLQKESALDYPERYRETERDHAVLAPDVYAPATEAQRAALADLGAPEPGEQATRLEAALAIDRWSEQPPGTGLDRWLHETDAAEHRREQLISDDGGVRPDRAELLQPPRGINPGDFQAAKALLDPYHALLDVEALTPTIGPGLAP